MTTKTIKGEIIPRPNEQYTVLRENQNKDQVAQASYSDIVFTPPGEAYIGSVCRHVRVQQIPST